MRETENQKTQEEAKKTKPKINFKKKKKTKRAKGGLVPRELLDVSMD